MKKWHIILGFVLLTLILGMTAGGGGKKIYKWVVKEEVRIQDSLKREISDIKARNEKAIQIYRDSINAVREQRKTLLTSLDSLQKIKQNETKKIPDYFTGDFNDRFDTFSELVTGQN